MRRCALSRRRRVSPSATTVGHRPVSLCQVKADVVTNGSIEGFSSRCGPGCAFDVEAEGFDPVHAHEINWNQNHLSSSAHALISLPRPQRCPQRCLPSPEMSPPVASINDTSATVILPRSLPIYISNCISPDSRGRLRYLGLACTKDNCELTLVRGGDP